MPSAEEPSNEGHADEGRSTEREPAEEPVEEIASTTLRIGLLILGAVLLLFATGQAVGIDVLALLSDALDTREARWLTVAFFGLILIAVAMRGFGRRQ